MADPTDTIDELCRLARSRSLYSRMGRAFQIFDLYDQEYGSFSAESGQIYAGPSPATVTPAHITELEALGWHADAEFNTFRYFT